MNKNKKIVTYDDLLTSMNLTFKNGALALLNSTTPTDTIVINNKDTLAEWRLDDKNNSVPIPIPIPEDPQQRENQRRRYISQVKSKKLLLFNGNNEHIISNANNNIHHFKFIGK